jgi:hypothetical protein
MDTKYLEYKNSKEKKCWFCNNGKHSKKWKFYTKNYQMKFYVCLPCLEQKGGTNAVVQELEKIPLPQNCINFKTKKGAELK